MSDSLADSLFLKALRREPVHRTPMWMMRQAGRYLPEYRQTRERAGSFLVLAKTPELACEVTLQPLRRFRLDAAILFSDILIIPDAMGLGLGFETGEGPVFARPVRSAADIRNLPGLDPVSDIRYVMDAVTLIRRELPADIPLIGFAGSPWTVATYMIEGRGSKDFRLAKGLLYSEPEAAGELMNHLADITADYLLAQVEAGANALMVFDTWGGVLTPDHYRKFSLESLQRITDRVRSKAPEIPVILFSKGCAAHLEALAETGCQGLGVDWTLNIGEARKRVGEKVALQGNLDPVVLNAGPEAIRAEAAKVIESFGPHPGHIFNLGHGINPAVPPDHVRVLVEAVEEFSRKPEKGSPANGV